MNTAYDIPPEQIARNLFAAFFGATYRIVSSATTLPQVHPGLLQDQAWFYTDEWQIGEREATAEIAAGNTTVYGNEEDFLASL